MTNRSRGREITEAHRNAPVNGETCDLTSLTPRQRLALDALVAGGSRAEAAGAAGVRPEQVSRWQRHPAFAYALAAAQAAVHAEVCGAVLDLVRSAVVELQRKVDEGDMAAIRLVYERLPPELLRRAMEPPVAATPEATVASLTTPSAFDDDPFFGGTPIDARLELLRREIGPTD